MTIETTRHLAYLTNQLVETLMTAAICANEIRATIVAELDGHGADRASHGGSVRPLASASANHRPVVDESTLTLNWCGKTCHLGYTVLFRLADRLSRWPNQYIGRDQLLRDVWEGAPKSPETVRSAVRNLRTRLNRAGMGDLAAAIQGRGGRYGLMLDGHP